MGSTKNTPRLLALSALLVVATVAVYAQMRGHDFVCYDDSGYLTENFAVRNGLHWEGVKWAFLTDTMVNWHPITWLSHMLDCELFGMDAGLHHLTSLAIHATNAVLLLWLLYSITGAVWRSALVAALFALHPLNVESVAWLAERKNVLSTMFWLWTTFAYVAWVRRPNAWRYGLCLVLFALGLMSKPMLVTLPCTLLLLDYWPLGRTRLLRVQRPDDATPAVQLSLGRLIVEKLPFLALSIGSSIVTYALQHHIAVAAVDLFPLQLRFANAAISYCAYLLDMLWPHDLAVLYPFGLILDLRKILAGLIVLPLITWWAWRKRFEKPYVIVGWLWYLGTLVPVIGILQVGSQRMADRYAYVPLIGAFIAIAWSAGAIAERVSEARGAIVTLALTCLAALGTATWRQTALWKDSLTIFEHTLSVTDLNPIMHNALGIAYGRLGRQNDAIPHFIESIRLKPDSPDTMNNLGIAYANLNRLEDAMSWFQKAIALKPGSREIHTSLAISLHRLGRDDEAIAHFEEALRIDPEYPEAHNSLGGLLAAQGKYDAAIEHYRTALAIHPLLMKAYDNLGVALTEKGQTDEAIASFRTGLGIDPGQIEMYLHLGLALVAQGKNDAAIECYRKGLEIDPNQVELHANLGDALAAAGRADEAAQAYATVARLDPTNVDRNLAMAREFVRQGRLDPAIDAFAQIVAAHPDRAAAHLELGNALAARGRYADAIPHLQQGLDKQHGDADAEINLGLAYDHLEQADRAIEHYRAALRIDSRRIPAHNNLGLALAKKGEFEEAIAHFAQALALDPNQPEVQNNLGNAYLRTGKFEDAIAHYKETLRLNPVHGDAASNLASALASLGRMDEAVAQFEALLERNPNDSTVRYNLGVALGQMRRTDEAVKQFEECVRQAPNNSAALYQLGLAAAMVGDTARAVERFRESLKYAPDRPEALMNLAWILATAQDSAVRDGAEAVRLASHADELLGGRNVGALMTLAAALAESKRWPEATDKAKRALAFAQASGQADLVATLQETVKRYSAGQPMYPTTK